MLRYLRKSLIVASALFCLATLLLWGRSYVAHDLIEAHRRGDARGVGFDDIRGVISQRGAIGGGSVRIGHPGVPGFSDRWLHSADAPPNPWPVRFSFLGFSYWNTTFPATGKYGVVRVVGFTVPHAVIAVLFAIAPTLAARRHWRGRRPGQQITADSDGRIRDAQRRDSAIIRKPFPAAAAAAAAA